MVPKCSIFPIFLANRSNAAFTTIYFFIIIIIIIICNCNEYFGRGYTYDYLKASLKRYLLSCDGKRKEKKETVK